MKEEEMPLYRWRLPVGATHRSSSTVQTESRDEGLYYFGKVYLDNFFSAFIATMFTSHEHASW
jgi:hypothetical protein